MEKSRQEVDEGMATASVTEEALQRIRISMAQVTDQIRELAQAVGEMTGSRDVVQRIMEEVAGLVESNSAAAQELAESSEQVLQAIAEVAAVSEENSAAAEEVSAGAEEVSAQVEETVASADSLAQMAQLLQQIVAQFNVEQAGVTQPMPVQRPAVGSLTAAPQSIAAAQPVRNGVAVTANGNGYHKDVSSR